MTITINPTVALQEAIEYLHDKGRSRLSDNLTVAADRYQANVRLLRTIKNAMKLSNPTTDWSSMIQAIDLALKADRIALEAEERS